MKINPKKKKFLCWGLGSIVAHLSGGIMNGIAVKVNDGVHMPVAYEGIWNWPDKLVTNARHVTMTADTHLRFLCDYIVYGGYINSPGDVMMDLATISVAAFLVTLIVIGFKSLK